MATEKVTVRVPGALHAEAKAFVDASPRGEKMSLARLLNEGLVLALESYGVKLTPSAKGAVETEPAEGGDA